MNRKFILKAPNGKRIVSTIETAECTYSILEVAPDPTKPRGFDFEHGDVQVDLDSTEQKENDAGQSLYLDEDGNRWPEDQIECVDD